MSEQVSGGGYGAQGNKAGETRKIEEALREHFNAEAQEGGEGGPRAVGAVNIGGFLDILIQNLPAILAIIDKIRKPKT